VTDSGTGPAIGTSSLRRKLGRPGTGTLLGTWIMYVRTPGIVRMAAQAGLDYVCIDLQHSSFGWETVADMCELARAAGVGAIVRPHVLDAGTLNRVQDLGAHGVMLPCIEDRATLERCLEWLRYPPRGERGVTVGGPAADYRPGGLSAQLMAAADDRQVVVVQIESGVGLAALEAIVEGGGMDVIELGRTDLAASLGVPGESRHPLVLAALDRVMDVCGRHGVGVGVMAGSPEEAADMVARGVACLNWRSDKAILLSSYQAFSEQIGALRR
jgi:2-keto-3-deoxy-L-rhamnonate aldolase RhmA